MTADLLGTTEAAERLGVSVRTVHRLVARGNLTPAGKLPGDTGAYLFDAADIAMLTRHDGPCRVSIYSTRIELGGANWSGRVLPYGGPHVQPVAADDVRAWVSTADIPAWCVPGHEAPDGGIGVGEWLRLGIDSVQLGESTVLLDETAARALAHDLLAWADLPKVAPR